ncbi:hypothetical protein RM780_04180 [Streptomyces sp. DSM 44917]|uniref:Uncharacterized protein n=1 Tax=Streptomyces boetiae TaxID=3075541 RepID=A0ABU2L3M3_9ACTN|nr:hypothetical protein [Streptomyces sp. DSM 44917]MDT0306160.1 hypothetical protein [Streptomyces sp. DSM 44917]
MTDTTTMTHAPLLIFAGPVECLERECEEYATEDGHDDPGVERCSHIRVEEVCAGCSTQTDDGEFVAVVAWPCRTADAGGAK